MPRKAATETFEFPDIQTKRLNRTGKALSPNTKAIYKSYLNKLVPKGIKTVADLETQEKTVISAIEAVFPDKNKQRTAVYAVMYALTDTGFCKTENFYYWFLQSLKNDDDPTKRDDLRDLYE